MVIFITDVIYIKEGVTYNTEDSVGYNTKEKISYNTEGDVIYIPEESVSWNTTASVIYYTDVIYNIDKKVI